jgi:transcriptional regulator GlxA family with amidase domain
MKMYQLKPSLWDFRCSVLLNQLIIELSDLYIKSGVQKDKVIIDILHLFVEHPERFFSITKLAAEAGMSPRSLSAQFKSQTGQSIHKYQINTKLEQIAKILRTNPKASLKNLAYTFGFYDEFHLSSSFKKKNGLSPSSYAKNAAKMPVPKKWFMGSV